MTTDLTPEDLKFLELDTVNAKEVAANDLIKLLDHIRKERDEIKKAIKDFMSWDDTHYSDNPEYSQGYDTAIFSAKEHFKPFI